MASPCGSSPPGDKSKARRTPRKLFKHRPKNSNSTSSSSNVDMPERLKHGDDAGDEEITASSEGPTMYMDMNQSIFGLIAAAGSRVDFTDRFQPPSSDEEDAGSDHEADEHVARTTLFRRHAKSPKGDKSGRRRLSDHKLLRSLPALPRLGKSRLRRDHMKPTAGPSDDINEVDGSDELDEEAGDTRLAPVLSRMLEARAEMAERPSFEMGRVAGEGGLDGDGDEVSPLARKLKEIFEFDEPEEVIEGMDALVPYPYPQLRCRDCRRLLTL
ncbi:hypothetical protein IMZ48_48615 [Candidatus Bathyarchaeota archaeon]|nr:hypothetical protein [Candidatus Bathyarchaeota archaeon]